MKQEEVDIEKVICPDVGKVKFVPDEEDDDPNSGHYEVNIVDAELDVFTVKFLSDGCATLDFSGNKYISLTDYNLKMLLKWLEETDGLFEEQTNNG
jgi:hypothetical protein